jgi:hypothetical protein
MLKVWKSSRLQELIEVKCFQRVLPWWSRRFWGKWTVFTSRQPIRGQVRFIRGWVRFIVRGQVRHIWGWVRFIVRRHTRHVWRHLVQRHIEIGVIRWKIHLRNKITM